MWGAVILTWSLTVCSLMHSSLLIALYQQSVLLSACQWKAFFLAPSKEGLDFWILPVKIQMDPLGAVSFISPQSIAGSSVPQLIINCEGGEEGRQAGLLFPLLKEDCQLNNSQQLKSQYISWSLLYGGAQLFSKALNEKENEEVQLHRDAYGAKNSWLLFSWSPTCLVPLQSFFCLFVCMQNSFFFHP